MAHEPITVLCLTRHVQPTSTNVALPSLLLTYFPSPPGLYKYSPSSKRNTHCDRVTTKSRIAAKWVYAST